MSVRLVTTPSLTKNFAGIEPVIASPRWAEGAWPRWYPTADRPYPPLPPPRSPRAHGLPAYHPGHAARARHRQHERHDRRVPRGCVACDAKGGDERARDDGRARGPPRWPPPAGGVRAGGRRGDATGLGRARRVERRRDDRRTT